MTKKNSSFRDFWVAILQAVRKKRSTRPAKTKKPPRSSIKPVRPIPQIKSLRNLWDAVVSGNHYQVFSPAWNERNHLRALHTNVAVNFMANHLAQNLGRQAMVVSGFIDKSPLFAWKSPKSNKAVRGEIADILVLVVTHNNQADVTTSAAFLQYKRTDKDNDVNRPPDFSTEQELELFGSWPQIEFSGIPGHYRLNPSGNPGPFPFAHFGAVSDPNSAKDPHWTVKEGGIVDSPVAVFGTPGGISRAFLDWLCAAAQSSYLSNAASLVNLLAPQNDFDRLVQNLLAALLDRNSSGKTGAAGGNVITHSAGKFAALDGLSFEVAHAAPSKFVSHPIPSHRINIPKFPGELQTSNEGMLLLYVVVGPEGRVQNASQASQRVEVLRK